MTVEGRKRRVVRKSHRKWLVKAGRTWCYYCGRWLAKHEVTADHVVPLSAGGYDRRKNVVTACAKCNSLKGSMTREEFLASPRFTDPSSGLNEHRRHHADGFNLEKAKAPIPA